MLKEYLVCDHCLERNITDTIFTQELCRPVVAVLNNNFDAHNFKSCEVPLFLHFLGKISKIEVV